MRLRRRLLKMWLALALHAMERAAQYSAELLAVAALGLATLAERLLEVDEPATRLDASSPLRPAVQDVALWVGDGWQLLELSLN